MQDHKWQILTLGNETLEGVDSMPNDGIRDACVAMTLELAGHHCVYQLAKPHGADLIFRRNTEMRTEIFFDGRPDKKLGSIIDYELGWAHGDEKAVLELGTMKTDPPRWKRLLLRAKPEIKPYVQLKYFEGRGGDE